MSRHIDTKWLEENAKEYSLGYYDYDEYAVPLSALDSAPSIDIVRCEECRWAEPNEFDDYDCRCHIPIFRVNADDFCSYGERKGE